MRLHGDANVGRIFAQQGTVDITADLTIIDRRNDNLFNIESVSMVLTAVAGTIGTSINPFDIDSSNFLLGTVTALAQGEVYLKETLGDMRVNTIRSITYDVTLVADQSILDANGVLDNNVTGSNINLFATYGSIGTGKLGASGNALEIDSSNPAQGHLNATAATDVDVTEVNATLYVSQVRSEEHTSELQSHSDLVCRLLLEKKKK